MKNLWLSMAIGCTLWLTAAEEVFRWSPVLLPDAVELQVRFEPGLYLYEDATRPQAIDANRNPLPLLLAPTATPHADLFSEATVPVYADGGGATFWRWDTAGTPGPWQLEVEFQGCRDNTPDAPGICFAPGQRSFTLEPDGRVAGGGANDSPVAGSANEAELFARLPALENFELTAVGAGYMDRDRFLAFLNGGTQRAGGENHGAPPAAWWWWALLAIGGGLALNLTPCVLPMIPVNLAIIGAGKQAESRWAALVRASFYAGGMILAYGVLGLLVVVAGARFGVLNASWQFNAVIAVVFLLLALAMSGLFQLDLSRFGGGMRLTKWKTAPAILAFVLGVAAALLAGACVAPVVIAVLTLAAGQYAAGDWWALFLPFLLGVGMALPWPLIGLGLRVLPRPGGWMVWVKYAFALFIFGMACYYGNLAWRLGRVTYDPAQQLAALADGLQEAASADRPLLIDFYASWCKNCTAMEHEVFPDAAVQARLRDFVVVRFQAENLNDPALQPLLRYCRVDGLPAFAVLEARH